jgi:hypothetical protein
VIRISLRLWREGVDECSEREANTVVRVELSEHGREGGSPEVGGGGCGGGALSTLHKGGEEYLANAISNLTKRE